MSDGAPAPPADLSPPLTFDGSRLARAVLRGLGWQLQFDGLPAAQGVLVVYPHTSNWDFPLGILAKWAIGMPVVFWGKQSLFAVPLIGRWLRWVGGRPVDRNAPGGVVDAAVLDLRQAREQSRLCWLALAPEGTRARGAGWRSGFYRVASGAAVPLALGFIDFGRRRLGVLSCLRLSDDADADMAEIARRYEGVQGYRPALAAPIRLT
ncbi:MAG: 1-acyl-sn-glycerol-3-phosphate acyltransferase [Rubrivivax sp.]|nr:1-acyl-sn-glycerol-3-phosphate acyltransferase [Rubrivivax sp.]